MVVVTEKMTKKKPVFGALPLLNMPSRVHDQENIPPRRPLHRVQAPVTCQKFYSLAEVQKQVLKLKELKRNWNVVTLDDRITMQKMKLPYLLPEYEIVIDDSLGFTLTVFHWLLPENHELYKKHHKSVKQVSIQQLIEEIMGYTLCNGITHRIKECTNIEHHVIPKSHDPLWDEDNEVKASKSYHHDDYHRSTNCELLISPSASVESCQPCIAVSSAQVKTQKNIKNRVVT